MTPLTDDASAEEATQLTLNDLPDDVSLCFSAPAAAVNYANSICALFWNQIHSSLSRFAGAGLGAGLWAAHPS